MDRRFPSLNVLALTAVLCLGLLRLTVSRSCETYRDCLGDYLQCCDGYCRRFCNLSCSFHEHCGSPGSIEEQCCEGQCISTSAICGKPKDDEEDVLSSPVIAVVVIFAVMLVVVVSCVLKSWLCKSRGICICFAGNEQQVELNSMSCRGSPRFVELNTGGSVCTEDGSNNTETSETQPFSIAPSWVGQDFRIAPPKATKKRITVT